MVSYFLKKKKYDVAKSILWFSVFLIFYKICIPNLKLCKNDHKRKK